LPVRIVLDRHELEKYPLRIGLSMQVTVDTSHVGRALDKIIYHPVYQTNIFNNLNKQADNMIANILQKNLGQLIDTAMTPLSRGA
jgi:membrane fusion protein (multidrug efflux system)